MVVEHEIQSALGFSVGIEVELKLEVAKLGQVMNVDKDLLALHWGIDRSVDGTYKRGCEIRTRPTNDTSHLMLLIDTIYDRVLPLKPEVTDTAGLHVHIDFAPHALYLDEYARRIAAIIVHWLPVENAFIEACYGRDWRRNKAWLKREHYCRPWTGYREDLIQRALMLTRYRALNILSGHTFEIRLFPSTTDREQCKKWVMMAVDWARGIDFESPKMVYKTIETKRVLLNLDPTLKRQYHLV
jgi:hypothetical protein